MALRPVSGLDGGGRLSAGVRLGPYAIVSPLGAGGMGEVYRAVDMRLGREVAVKVLDRRGAGDPDRRRRFEREARLASAVSHPHLLTVFDVGEWEDTPYVVSELLEGETLRAHLRPGLLDPRTAVEYAVQVARGLEALHARGIVHRDLKPENLFVTNEGRIKILDLGLAGPSRDDEVPDGDVDGEPWAALTTAGTSAGGTAAYMSPEQVRRRPADSRSDIFACGVVLYEMLARRRPFDEETEAETMTAVLRREPTPLLAVDPELPPALAGVVERCLKKRPEDRFHSAHDLALALEATLETRPLRGSMHEGGAGAESERVSSTPPRRTRRATLVAVTTVAMAGAWLARGSPEKAPGPAAMKEGPATLVAFDAATGGLDPFLNGIAADGVDFSPDLRFAVYTSYPEGELWRSRLRDGSDRRRLTEGPLRAALPRWSPDGRTIAFAGRPPHGAWQIHLVSAEDGEVEVLPLTDATDPGWTSDGRAIVFGVVSDNPAALFRFDLATRRQTILPGSDGLFSPRPSPDGRWLAALRRGSEELVLFDSRTGRWSSLTDHAVSYPAWTRASDWLHFRDGREGTAFYRVDPLTQRVESVARVDERALAGGEWGAWSGLTPEGAPLMLVERQQDRFAVGDWWPARSQRGADRVDPRLPEERKTSR